MGRVRRSEFAAGRICARLALERLGARGPVLAREDGSARWPDGVRGSISHKDGLAVALVGAARLVNGLGVDLELARPLPPAAWRAVLTEAELGRLAGLSRDSDLAIRLAFSAKEAYYKWFRSTGRVEHVGFQDIGIVRYGATLRFESVVPDRFPAPHGLVATVDGWLMTVVWSR